MIRNKAPELDAVREELYAMEPNDLLVWSETSISKLKSLVARINMAFKEGKYRMFVHNNTAFIVRVQ